MKSSRVAKRYARALLGLSDDRAQLETWGAELERLESSYPLRSLAVVVARHGRIADLAAVSQSYQDQLDLMLGRARATLTFAREPGAQDTEAVVRGLEAMVRKTVIATVKVDQSLLGGVVAELEGKIYDGSLATRLGEAARRLAG